MLLIDIPTLILLIGSVAGGVYGSHQSILLYHEKTPPESRRWFISALAGLGGMTLGATTGVMAALALVSVPVAAEKIKELPFSQPDDRWLA